MIIKQKLKLGTEAIIPSLWVEINPTLDNYAKLLHHCLDLTCYKYSLSEISTSNTAYGTEGTKIKRSNNHLVIRRGPKLAMLVIAICTAFTKS